MKERYCGSCEHYCWIEDYYDDGSYVNEEFCEEKLDDPCTYYQRACDKYVPLYE